MGLLVWCLTLSGSIHVLEVDSSVWTAIFLGGHHHLAEPVNWHPNGHWLDDSHPDVTVLVCRHRPLLESK